MIQLLRSLVFTLVFYVGSVPLVAAALIGGAISEHQLFEGPRRWAGWFLWCARVLLGIRLRVEGDIPPGPYLFAVKHQSAYETILTLWLFDRPAVVMKAELERIPIWGPTARRHGAIFVNRAGSASTLRVMMKAAQAAVAAGRPVIIFPEGSRMAVGQQPSLQSGFAGIYKMLKLPVVPVALNSGRVWPKGFVKGPGVITVRFLEAIPPGLPREDIEARVHIAINRLD